jgi:hypothetical protein
MLIVIRCRHSGYRKHRLPGIEIESVASGTSYQHVVIVLRAFLHKQMNLVPVNISTRSRTTADLLEVKRLTSSFDGARTADWTFPTIIGCTSPFGFLTGTIKGVDNKGCAQAGVFVASYRRKIMEAQGM